MPFLLLMPSYNQARYLREAIDSVLAQDDPDWELWVVDNSTDESPEILKTYTDPRIHAHHIPRRMDPGTCLNWMLERAEGEGFSYIHTDNRLLPNYVRLSKASLADHPLALSYCDYWEMSEGGKRLRIRRRPRQFPLARLFSPDSLGVPFSATTKLAATLGGFTSDDLADDVYFALRADEVGPRVHIATPLMEYRVHDQSRALQSGVLGVAQAIHRSALMGYRERPASLPDPFTGAGPRILAHVERASRMALSLAQGLLAGQPAQAPLWIEGTGPASFWLAYGCASLGRMPAGFVAETPGALLGCPVIPLEELAPEAVLLRPRRRGTARSIGPRLSQAVRWLAKGLPPLDHALKRFPGDLMAAALIPYQAQGPAPEALWIVGEGPMAAYLAFGAEQLGRLPVRGFVHPGRHPWEGLESRATPPEGAVAWCALGQAGDGLPWRIKGEPGR